MSDEKTMGQAIQIDEARIRDHLGEMVRGTVEETLNADCSSFSQHYCLRCSASLSKNTFQQANVLLET
jgi:hypothetical protein